MLEICSYGSVGVSAGNRRHYPEVYKHPQNKAVKGRLKTISFDFPNGIAAWGSELHVLAFCDFVFIFWAVAGWSELTGGFRRSQDLVRSH